MGKPLDSVVELPDNHTVDNMRQVAAENKVLVPQMEPNMVEVSNKYQHRA
jgi:hypothetical protein